MNNTFDSGTNSWLADAAKDIERQKTRQAGQERMQVDEFLEDPENHLDDFVTLATECFDDLSLRYGVALRLEFSKFSAKQYVFSVRCKTGVLCFGRIGVGGTISGKTDFWTTIIYARYMAPDGWGGGGSGYSVEYLASKYTPRQLFTDALERNDLGFKYGHQDKNEAIAELLVEYGNTMRTIYDMMLDKEHTLERYLPLLSQAIIDALKQRYDLDTHVQPILNNKRLQVVSNVTGDVLFYVGTNSFTDTFGYMPYTEYTVYPIKPNGEKMYKSLRIVNHSPDEIADEMIRSIEAARKVAFTSSD